MNDIFLSEYCTRTTTSPDYVECKLLLPEDGVRNFTLSYFVTCNAIYHFRVMSCTSFFAACNLHHQISLFSKLVFHGLEYDKDRMEMNSFDDVPVHMLCSYCCGFFHKFGRIFVISISIAGIIIYIRKEHD